MVSFPVSRRAGVCTLWIPDLPGAERNHDKADASALRNSGGVILLSAIPSRNLATDVRPREVWGWMMFDFANSGYTTVVITAVFNAYFVAVVAGGCL